MSEVKEFKKLPPEEIKKLTSSERMEYLKAQQTYEAQQGLKSATSSGSPSQEGVLVNPTADKRGNELASKVNKSKARKKRKESPVRWEVGAPRDVDKIVRARLNAIEDEGIRYNRNQLIAEAMKYFLSNVPVNVHIERLEEALEDECA